MSIESKKRIIEAANEEICRSGESVADALRELEWGIAPGNLELSDDERAAVAADWRATLEGYRSAAERELAEGCEALGLVASGDTTYWSPNSQVGVCLAEGEYAEGVRLLNGDGCPANVDAPDVHTALHLLRSHLIAIDGEQNAAATLADVARLCAAWEVQA